MSEKKKLLSTKEAAEYCGFKLSYFRKLMMRSIVLPNIRQVVEHWLLRHPEHADNPERSLVLAKSDGARCPFGFLDQRAA